MDSENVKKEENLENVENLPKKPSKTKKIVKKIVGVSLLLVLVAIITSVAVLAFLPKNFNFGFDAPDSIEIHTSNSSSSANKTFVSKNSTIYQDIVKLYNQSFDSNILASLLQGKLKNSVTVTEGYKSISTITGPYLVFCYSTSQKLTLNGKEYKADIISDNNYIEIVIEVKNTNSLSEINAYFKYRDTGLNNYSYVRFSTLAAQASLYNYIENL